MGESLTELIQWLNDLLQLNYTKVEQCGTGVAYCQIINSIYGDLPMSRVKMNAKHEYEYLTNFKILQNAFTARKIDKSIPVDQLVKCKMQDNLEFLQWIRRFWDANASGEPSDSAARRKGGGAEPPGVSVQGSPRRDVIGGHRAGSASPPTAQALEQKLERVNYALQQSKESQDVYINQLRDIDILVQQQLDALEGEGKDDVTLRNIRAILHRNEGG